MTMGPESCKFWPTVMAVFKWDEEEGSGYCGYLVCKVKRVLRIAGRIRIHIRIRIQKIVSCCVATFL